MIKLNDVQIAISGIMWCNGHFPSPSPSPKKGGHRIRIVIILINHLVATSKLSCHTINLNQQGFHMSDSE